MQELRFAARRLRQNPGFVFTAVAVLAIGIGLNTAIFSVVDAVVFRPLPFPEANRMIRVGESLKGFGEVSTAYPNFLDWRREAKTLESAAAVKPTNVTLTDRGSAQRVPVMQASASFFDVLRVYPTRGRAFRGEEDQHGAGGRVVITDGLWKRVFGGDPGIVGRNITLQGEGFTVIGIMPASFAFPYFKVDAIIPIGVKADANRGNHMGESVARLKPGVTLAQANAELNAIGRRLAELYPKSNTGWSLTATWLQDYFTRDYRVVMLTLLAAVGIVLLMGCVNLAGLMLVRAAARRRELAIRTALGASSWAILRGTLAESLILALGGGIFGIVLGVWSIHPLLSLLPENTPMPAVSLDARVLAFALLATVFSGVIFGLLPAVRSLGSDPAEALKEGGRANTGGVQGNRLRNILVVAEISLALMLALGAGLVVKSFTRLIRVSPGFDARHALTMRIGLTGPRYEKDAPAIAFWDRLLESTAGQSSIRKAGLVSFLPMSENDTQSGYSIEGRPQPKTASDTPFADNFAIGGDYFGAMGIRLVRGRAFLATDREKSPGVAIVDTEFARKNFPGGDDPLRHRMIAYGSRALQIVGVVEHVKAYDLTGQQYREQMYFPYAQNVTNEMSLTIEPGADSGTVVAAVRNSARAIDPDVPVYMIRPMEEWLNDSAWRARLSTLLLTAFAVVALVLAGIGIYGVMAFSVSQRTQEIGIRLALGATPANVLRMVLRQAGMLSAAGIVAGVLAALPVTRFLQSILYQVSPSDLGVIISAAVLLAVVGLAAGAIPALRAAHTDPLEAIRYE